MGMGWPEDDRDLDLKDYKIIANTSGEWAALDDQNARERIKNRHIADSYQGGA